MRYRGVSTGIHRARFEIDWVYDGQTYSYYTDIVGETKALKRAVLSLDDIEIARESTGSTATEMILTIQHPYADTDYADQSARYSLKRGSKYAIVGDFGHSAQSGLLKSRQARLDKLLADPTADLSSPIASHRASPE